MKLIWRLRTQPASASASVISLTRPQSALSRGNSMADLHASSDEKGPSTIEFTNTDLEKPVQGQRFWTPRIMSKREKERKDKKMAEQGDSRSMRLLSPFYSGLAAAVALCMSSSLLTLVSTHLNRLHYRRCCHSPGGIRS